MRLRVVLLALPLLHGCGTWVNADAPSADFGTQMRLCEEQSFSLHPPRYDWFSGFHRWPWGPACFRTATGVYCNAFPPLRDWPVAQDLSGFARRQATRECLAAHRWTFVPRLQADPSAEGKEKAGGLPIQPQ